MSLRFFQLLNAGDTSTSKLSDSHNSNLIDLFHLKWRVLPSPTSKAPRNLESVSNGDPVLLVNLTVDNAPKQAAYVSENHCFVLLKLELVLLILLGEGKLSSTQFGLNEKRNLVCVLRQVHSDWEPDSISMVNLPIQRTFGGFKTDFAEFFSL